MKTGMKIITVLLWISFLSVLCIILYLSFQDGAEAKALGKDFIYRFACKYYNRDSISDMEMVDITYRFRQYGRIAIFIVLGILGTATIHVTFYNWYWIVRTFIVVAMLLGVAIFTEKYKVYLPTRHFSQKEMIYSIVGSMLGVAIVSCMTLVYAIVKGILKIMFDKE